MKTRPSDARHEAFFQDIIPVLNKHHGALDASEMLAVAARLVGMLIAMQDQRRMTGDMAMELVAKNIEGGNAHAITGIFSGINMGQRQ